MEFLNTKLPPCYLISGPIVKQIRLLQQLTGHAVNNVLFILLSRAELCLFGMAYNNR